MTNHKKDESERRDVPDRREFLSDEGHRLAQAEQKARVYPSKRKLLWALIACGLLGLSLLALFWLVNR